MKRTLFLLALVVSAAGCASTNKLVLDDTVRPPTTAIEIYRAEHPSKPHRLIAEYTFLGPRQDEIRAVKFFASEARKAGANGIIVEWPPQGDSHAFGLAGNNGGFLGAGVNYVFKGTAYAYPDGPRKDVPLDEKGFQGIDNGKADPVVKLTSPRGL